MAFFTMKKDLINYIVLLSLLLLHLILLYALSLFIFMLTSVTEWSVTVRLDAFIFSIRY